MTRCAFPSYRSCATCSGSRLGCLITLRGTSAPSRRCRLEPGSLRSICASAVEVETADSSFSMEPAEFREMVEAVRSVERAIAPAGWELPEREVRQREGRRSIYACAPIQERRCVHRRQYKGGTSREGDRAQILGHPARKGVSPRFRLRAADSIGRDVSRG